MNGPLSKMISKVLLCTCLWLILLENPSIKNCFDLNFIIAYEKFFFWLSHFIIFPTIVHKIASRILVSCYKERYDKIDAHKGLVALHFNGHNGVKNLSEIGLEFYISRISRNMLVDQLNSYKIETRLKRLHSTNYKWHWI